MAMFESLTEKLQQIFRTLHGEGHLTPFQIEKGLKNVRMVLLGADVHFSVVKDLMERVKSRALSDEVIKSLTPAQQVVRLIRDEITSVLGEQEDLNLKGNPAVIMLAGLQGSGKTTTCAKLAFYLKKKGRRSLLLPLDVRRPAAREQLISLAKSINIDVVIDEEKRLEVLIRRAIQRAKEYAYDVMICDTAGRLHVDSEMMEELSEVTRLLSPQEILYAADAMTGQDAVRSAGEFNRTVPMTGIVLTKMDGDARGGAIISVRAVTGLPVKFVGTGEKPGDFEQFDAKRLAGRILGMGDTLTLIEKAEAAMDEEEAEETLLRMRKNQFTLDDVLKQFKMLKKMGSISDLLQNLPAGGPFKGFKDVDIDEKAIARVEAIIKSMTPVERERPDILQASRKRRIAMGSGTSVEEVNRLIKQYRQMKEMMKQFGKKKFF